MQKQHKSVHANYWNMLTSKVPDIESTFARIEEIQKAIHREKVDNFASEILALYGDSKRVKLPVFRESDTPSVAITVFGFILTLIELHMLNAGNVTPHAVTYGDVLLCFLCFVFGGVLYGYDRYLPRRQLANAMSRIEAAQSAYSKAEALYLFLADEVSRTKGAVDDILWAHFCKAQNILSNTQEDL